MADDLLEIHERIAFCRTQNRNLIQEVKAYIDRAITVSNDTTEEPWHVVKVRLNEPVPISIRSATGQIANELRACLDGLACALATRNGKSTSQTYFPISKDSAIFAVDGLHKTKKLSASDQALLLSFQTHGDAAPKLFGLHELDRNRKHINLGLQTAGNAGIGLQNGRVEVLIAQIVGGPLEVGVEVPIVRLIPDGRVDLSVSFRVAFDTPSQLAGLTVTETLEWFADEVERIVSAFD